MDNELFNVFIYATMPCEVIRSMLRYSTNCVELKIPGQRGVCHISPLGKTAIIINVNKNGSGV